MNLSGKSSRFYEPSRFFIAISVLILLQTAFILYSHWEDYFFLDDFLGFIVARYSGLSISYLLHDVFGQFIPGYRLFDYLYTEIIGLHYTGVRLLDIATICATSTLVMILARHWRTPASVVAVGFAFVPFSPIFSVIFQWLSAAMAVLDGMTLGVAALVCLCLPRPVNWRRRLASALLYALALMFYAKILFVPVLAFSLRLFASHGTGVPIATGIKSALKDTVLYIPVALAYLAFVFIGHYSSGLPPTGISPVLAFIRVGLTDGFAANLFGLDPALPGRRLMACALMLLPMVISVIRLPSTLIVWLGFFLHFVLGMAAIAWGRVTLFGVESAAGSRYHPETAVFFLICFVVAFSLPGRQAARLAIFKKPPDWLGYTAAFAMALALTHASMQAPLLYQPDDGQVAAYVTNFRKSLEQATCSRIVDTTVPSWLMPDWMKPLNHVHDFAMLFDAKACFTDEKANSAEIDDFGRIKLPQ